MFIWHLTFDIWLTDRQTSIHSSVTRQSQCKTRQHRRRNVTACICIVYTAYQHSSVIAYKFTSRYKEFWQLLDGQATFPASQFGTCQITRKLLKTQLNFQNSLSTIHPQWPNCVDLPPNELCSTNESWETVNWPTAQCDHRGRTA